PHATLHMPDTITLYPGQSQRLDPGGNCLYFSWFPAVGLNNANISNPMLQPDVNTRYVVHGTTEAGCSVTDSVEVLVKPDSYLDLPNAFVPGNGMNNTLKVLRLGDAKLKQFAIY